TYLISPVSPAGDRGPGGFEFDASKPVQRFECSEDGSAWLPCASPVDTTVWLGSDDRTGSHTFAVRAVDDAGNVDPAPATAAWTITTTAPANNAFGSSVRLSGASGSVGGTNLAAFKEGGEPDHAGNPGGASVWYRWTPSSSGTVEFDTEGSSIDTLLAVYTGSSVDSL